MKNKPTTEAELKAMIEGNSESVSLMSAHMPAMTYTKEQLEAMSDFEINVIIANIIYRNLGGQDFTKRLVVRHSYENGCDCIYYCGGDALDYCNNPSDMMPLVFESKINSLVTLNGWMAFSEHEKSLESECENLLRAYAIVYILIKQA